MSVLRGVGKGVGSVFFCIFLALAVLPLGLYKFTDYNNLSPFFANTVKEQISSKVGVNQLALIKSVLLIKCESADKVQFPLENQTIFLDCTKIKETNASELPSLVGVAMFESIYHKEYSCNFRECLSQTQGQDKFFLLVSKKGHDYYLKLTYYLLIGAVFFLVLLIICSKRWLKLVNPGICLMVVGLNYFFLNYFKTRIGVIPNEVSDVIFSSFTSIFLKLLIAGAVLTAAGIILHLIFKKNGQNPPVK